MTANTENPIMEDSDEEAISDDDKGFVCDFVHTADGGNLKMEDSGKYATQNNFLYNKSARM